MKNEISGFGFAKGMNDTLIRICQLKEAFTMVSERPKDYPKNAMKCLNKEITYQQEMLHTAYGEVT